MTEQKRIPNTECFVCKKAIYRRPSQIKQNKNKVFCSMACYGVFCRKEIPCVQCGKLILSGLNKKTCSRSCSNKYRSGISYKINKPRDKVFSIKRIKMRIIKKRGDFCERCSYNKKEVLQIHHKDRNRLNNKEENLEILCPNCHMEEHLLKK